MKKALLDNLYNDVYCRLKASKTHGVGVYAIKDIPKDMDPFKYTGKKCFNQKIIDVTEEEVKKLHPEVKKLVNDFYHKDDGVYGIPYEGLNSCDITFYLNSSEKPNLGLVEDKKCTMLQFRTLRKIKKGEELFIDYRDYED